MSQRSVAPSVLLNLKYKGKNDCHEVLQQDKYNESKIILAQRALFKESSLLIFVIQSIKDRKETIMDLICLGIYKVTEEQGLIKTHY